MTAPTAKPNQTKPTAPTAKPSESAAAAVSRTAPVEQPKRETVKPKAPALDFGKLTIADAPAPVRKSSRTRADNPLVPVMRESWEKRNGDKGAGKAVTVQTSQAQELINLIRYAANELSETTKQPIGSAIVAKDNGNGTTTVTFAAKKRRERRAKQDAKQDAKPTEQAAPAKQDAAK